MDEDKNWKPLVKKMDDQVNTHSFEIVMKLASPAGGHHCTQVAIALLTMPSLVQIFVHPKFYADEILSIRKKGCQDSELGEAEEEDDAIFVGWEVVDLLKEGGFEIAVK